MHERTVLSMRMKMNADLVPKGSAVADIGCDHGYVSIYLATVKKCRRVIAMDVNAGPLSIARDHIKQTDMHKIIECRQSDGMEALQPGEADTVLIAGMGGMLICRILQQSKNILDEVNTLVLQPQSDQMEVRCKLFELGFRIEEERFCKDAGKYYLAIRAVRGTETEPYTNAEYRYGRILLERKDPLYNQYLLEEMNKREHLLSKLLDHPSERAKVREMQIHRELIELKQLMAKYYKVHTFV